MNKIKGYIRYVSSKENISIVEVDVKSTSIFLLLLENPKDVSYLKEGREVSLIFSPFAVKISEDKPEKVSILNILDAYITYIKEGNILSEIVLDFEGDIIKSYITTLSLKKLSLEIGKKVYLLIDSVDIMLEVE
ncbi:MAG: TOBE domain-containing protein [Hydrogenothermaceae bacterium]